MSQNHIEQSVSDTTETLNSEGSGKLLVRTWRIVNLVLAIVIAMAIIDDFHTLTDIQGNLRWERLSLFYGTAILGVLALIEAKTLKISAWIKSRLQ